MRIGSDTFHDNGHSTKYLTYGLVIQINLEFPVHLGYHLHMKDVS